MRELPSYDFMQNGGESYRQKLMTPLYQKVSATNAGLRPGSYQILGVVMAFLLFGSIWVGWELICWKIKRRKRDSIEAI